MINFTCELSKAGTGILDTILNSKPFIITPVNRKRIQHELEMNALSVYLFNPYDLNRQVMPVTLHPNHSDVVTLRVLHFDIKQVAAS